MSARRALGATGTLGRGGFAGCGGRGAGRVQHVEVGEGEAVIAAIKKHQAHWQGKRLACILSGGNVSMEILKRVMKEP